MSTDSSPAITTQVVLTTPSATPASSDKQCDVTCPCTDRDSFCSTLMLDLMISPLSDRRPAATTPTPPRSHTCDDIHA